MAAFPTREPSAVQSDVAESDGMNQVSMPRHYAAMHLDAAPQHDEHAIEVIDVVERSTVRQLSGSGRRMEIDHSVFPPPREPSVASAASEESQHSATGSTVSPLRPSDACEHRQPHMAVRITVPPLRRVSMGPLASSPVQGASPSSLGASSSPEVRERALPVRRPRMRGPAEWRAVFDDSQPPTAAPTALNSVANSPQQTPRNSPPRQRVLNRVRRPRGPAEWRAIFPDSQPPTAAPTAVNSPRLTPRDPEELVAQLNRERNAANRSSGGTPAEWRAVFEESPAGTGMNTEVNTAANSPRDDASPEQSKKKRHGLTSRRPDCVICLAAGRDTAIDPCGHISMCAACATAVKECPVCRGPINKMLKVYIA